MFPSLVFIELLTISMVFKIGDLQARKIGGRRRTSSVCRMDNDDESEITAAVIATIVVKA
jgi:hypothetical protein